MKTPKNRPSALPANMTDAIAQGFIGPAHQQVIDALMERDWPLLRAVSKAKAGEKLVLPSLAEAIEQELQSIEAAAKSGFSWQDVKKGISEIHKEWQAAAALLQANFAASGLRSASKAMFFITISVPQAVAIYKKPGVTLNVTAQPVLGDLHFSLSFSADAPLPAEVVVATPMHSVRGQVDVITRSARVVIPGAKVMEWSEIEITIIER